MLQHIKQLKEIDNIDEVNDYLKCKWILIAIVNSKNGFSYIIGLPYLGKLSRK